MAAKAEMITLRKRGRCYRPHIFLSFAIGNETLLVIDICECIWVPGPTWWRDGPSRVKVQYCAADGEEKGQATTELRLGKTRARGPQLLPLSVCCTIGDL
jgi:hypothetical protein